MAQQQQTIRFCSSGAADRARGRSKACPQALQVADFKVKMESRGGPRRSTTRQWRPWLRQGRSARLSARITSGTIFSWRRVVCSSTRDAPPPCWNADRTTRGERRVGASPCLAVTKGQCKDTAPYSDQPLFMLFMPFMLCFLARLGSLFGNRRSVSVKSCLAKEVPSERLQIRRSGFATDSNSSRLHLGTVPHQDPVDDSPVANRN